MINKTTDIFISIFLAWLICCLIVGIVFSENPEEQTHTGGEVIFVEAPQIEIYSEIPSLCPIGPSHRRQITSEYGRRWSPIYHAWIEHGGIDIAGLWHEEIQAAGSGIVTDVYLSHPVWGKSVRILHANGYVTFYAHLNCTYVYEGQKVQEGQVIGRMGNTGCSDGEHLHYECWRYGVRVNPLDVMREQPDQEGFF